MPKPKLTVFQGDITCLNVDAIVNAANKRMLGGGGVDGAIHNAAGRRLRAACERVPEIAKDVRCPVGEARITPGFDLPAKAVIHTVGPVYAHKTGNSTTRRAPLPAHPDPAQALADCYRNSLELAVKYRHRTVAFAAISCGVYGYPPDEAAQIAVGVSLSEDWDLDEIIFVAFEDEVAAELEIAVDNPPDVSSGSVWLQILKNKAAMAAQQAAPAATAPAPTPAPAPAAPAPQAAATAPAPTVPPTPKPAKQDPKDVDLDDLFANF